MTKKIDELLKELRNEAKKTDAIVKSYALLREKIINKFEAKKRYMEILNEGKYD